MGTAVMQFSHDDIDPSSIAVPSFGHSDIDPSSINVHSAPAKSWLDTQVPVIGGTIGGHIQGTLDALPLMGTVAGGGIGGVIGAGTGGITVPLVGAVPGAAVGAVEGAGAGAALGETLKHAGEKFILGKDPTRAELYGGPVKAAIQGVTGEMGGQALGAGLGMAARSPVGQAVIGKAGSGAAKIGELFTGVPKQEIKTAAAHMPEIEAMSSANDHNTQDIADAIRENLNQTVSTHRKGLNAQISDALEAGKNAKPVDITPVISALEKQKASLDPSLHPEAIKDIDDLLQRVKGTTQVQKNAVTGYIAPTEKTVVGQGRQQVPVIDTTASRVGEQGLPSDAAQNILGNKTISRKAVNQASEQMLGHPDFGGVRSVVDDGSSAADSVIELPTQGAPKYFASQNKLHDINKFLQDQASSAYGQTATGFQIGTKAANAAKAAAGAGREILGDVSPEIAVANAKLARLHEIEDVMNKNMLAEGKTASPLLAAGAGTNQANAKILKQLGEETGTDVLGEAQKLSAARTFGQPGLMPVDSTGKAVGRMGLASGLGFITGGPAGAVGAAALTSPAALKVAIKAGRAAGGESGQAIASTIGRSIISGKLLDTTMSKDAAPSAPANQDSAPEMQLTKPATKGPDKWANDGAQKLISHAPDDKDTIEKARGAMSDPKIKSLLIQASDLKPNTKAMDAVMTKLRSKLASGDE